MSNEILDALSNRYWPYFSTVDIETAEGYMKSHNVEWIEKVCDPDEGPADNDGDRSLWEHPVYGVCKININGKDRYFRRDGVVISHSGEEWGDVYEVVFRTETVSRFVKATERNDLAPQEIEAALVEEANYGVDWDAVGYGANSVLIDGVDYPIEVLEYEGGSEGDWSIDTYVVFKVGSQVFKKTGQYQSHYGNDWDGPLHEVRAVPKTITVWEKK